MTITSTAFQNNDHIPSQYTCEGANIHPSLTFSETPREAGSLALIMDDPDAPSGVFTHWLLYNLSPGTLQIMDNAIPETGVEGLNDFQHRGYSGPCPPHGTHRYYFRLYALKSKLDLPAGATRKEVDAALEDQVLDTAELIGLFERPVEPPEVLSKQDLSEYTDDRDTLEGQMVSH